MTAQLSASTRSPSTEVADFGTRFSAFMIDAVILFALQWIVFIALSRQLQAAGWTSIDECAPGSVQFCEGPSTLLWALLLVVLIVTTVGYHAVFDGQFGATPGKRLLGLKVVNANVDAPIGLGLGALRALVRQAFWLVLLFVLDVSPFDLSMPALLFVVLPLLALATFAVGAFSADGRALHDMVATSRVVRTGETRTLRRVPAPSKPAPAIVPDEADGEDAVDPDTEDPDGEDAADPDTEDPDRDDVASELADPPNPKETS